MAEVAREDGEAVLDTLVAVVAHEVCRRVVIAAVSLGFVQGVAFQAAEGGFYGDDLLPGDWFRHG
jgi:hypothetical protein